MHYFVTEMCTCVHTSVKNGALGIFVQCIVGFIRWVYYVMRQLVLVPEIGFKQLN